MHSKRRYYWSLAIVLLVGLAGLAGVSTARFSGDGHAADVPSGSMAISDANSAQVALAAAQARTNIQPRTPTFFPTSANRLVMVDAFPGSVDESSPLRFIELRYQGDASPVVGLDGTLRPSTLDVQLVSTRLNRPPGSLLRQDLAGYELYKQVVSEAANGDATRTVYTGLRKDGSIILMFTGEQPASVDDIGRMLGSFRP